MTIGLTWRRTARRIKRLKEGVLTISPDYSDRDPRLFGALAYRSIYAPEHNRSDRPHQEPGPKGHKRQHERSIRIMYGKNVRPIRAA